MLNAQCRLCFSTYHCFILKAHYLNLSFIEHCTLSIITYKNVRTGHTTSMEENKYIRDLVWKMFEKTGGEGYYLLYKRLDENG